MKNYLKISGLIFFLLVSGFTDAQVIEGYLKSKARVATKRAFERTDEKVDDEINKAVDKGVDNVLNKSEGEGEQDNTGTEGTSPEGNERSVKTGTSSQDAANNAFLKKLGISGAPANIQEAYNFKGYLLMELEAWNSEGQKENQTLYKTFYSDDAKSFAMEFSEPDKGKSLIIFDNANKAMIILTDDGKEKSGMVMPLNYEETVDEPAVENVNIAEADKTAPESIDYNLYGYKKTGNKKNISGYSCEEYAFENDEEIVSFWVTRDLPSDLYTRMFSLNTFASMAYAGGIHQGFTMEWDYRKKGGSERSKMIIKEVDKNKPSTISTKGFNIMSFGNY